MIVIRLSRLGKRGMPFYRIVVTDKKRKREGKATEILGFWHSKEKNAQIDDKRLDFWLKQGALPSPAVSKLLASKK